MSCDPGFPDLEPSREKSLCDLLKRVERREELMLLMLAAMVEDPSIRKELISETEMVRNRYGGLAELIRLQFPYRRAERRGEFTRADACENAYLLLMLSNLDSEASTLTGCGYRPLRLWFDRDATMPRPLALFAEIKQPRREKAEARK